MARKKQKLYDYRKKRKKFFNIKVTRKQLPVIGMWIFKILVASLMALVCVLNFGQKVSTVGNSMNPVLENGDIVLVNKLVYNATSPKRGDIIVFSPKGNENTHYSIKRVIGLPGETIQVIESSIYIDGEKLDEDYEVTKISDPGLLGDEITLDNDEYFVLGDSRNNSEDSRNPDIGNVERDHIYGKPWFIVSPGNRFGFVKD